jgi:hypothetical protein
MAADDAEVQIDGELEAELAGCAEFVAALQDDHMMWMAYLLHTCNERVIKPQICTRETVTLVLRFRVGKSEGMGGIEGERATPSGGAHAGVLCIFRFSKTGAFAPISRLRSTA